MLGEVMEADTDVVPVVAGPSMASSTGNGDSASDKITYNPGELKREEYFLRKIYLRMSKQLHKLEVEELELKQRIRKKDMQETDALLPPPALPPPALLPPPAIPKPATPSTRKHSKSKGHKKRRRKYSTSASETTASEYDEYMSASSSSYTVSPLRNVTTPTRRSARLGTTGQSFKSPTKSPGSSRTAKALLLPDDELLSQETLNLDIDLSALNNLHFKLSEAESEEEIDD